MRNLVPLRQSFTDINAIATQEMRTRKSVKRMRGVTESPAQDRYGKPQMAHVRGLCRRLVW